MFRVIPGVHVVPYNEKIEPTNEKKESSKEETFNLATLIHKIAKDPKEERAFYKYYREKKKKKSSKDSFKKITEKILKIKEASQTLQFQKAEDLTLYITSMIEELLEAFLLLRALVKPIKDLLFEDEDSENNPALYSLNILELTEQAVSNLRHDLLDEHHELSPHLEKLNLKIIAKTNECIIKVQNFMKKTSLGSSNEMLQDLFQIQEMYEQEHRLYSASIEYIENLVKSYESDQLLNFFVFQTEEQLKKTKSSKGNEYKVSVLAAEKQVFFLESILKSQEQTICKKEKKLSQIVSRKTSLINKIKKKLENYKDQLNLIKEKRDKL
ncbi:hypothetical protein AB751O23_AK_00230 [Chlamydiales bacterium SCGC AB-751-O23]|jgi:hypothetical protein|nr:hypothetical protein AB751O23_AK_00230 [Chlamydiales bacterium SCGC AB-751-O23]